LFQNAPEHRRWREAHGSIHIRNAKASVAEVNDLWRFLNRKRIAEKPNWSARMETLNSHKEFIARRSTSGRASWCAAAAWNACCLKIRSSFVFANRMVWMRVCFRIQNGNPG
jgi:hypothetical protein